MKYKDIKDFNLRCEEHPDHQSGMISYDMLQQRLHEEIAELRAYIEQDRRELQSKGEHPAPCARFCEATAFKIEIRNLKKKLEQLTKQEPVAWGVDWGKAGDIPCVSIIKRLPNSEIEVMAVEYAPYSYISQPQPKEAAPRKQEPVAWSYYLTDEFRTSSLDRKPLQYSPE